MLEDLGPAPLCLELDLDSFDGPREWIVQFRRRSGWLVLADCTIQSAHDLLTTRLIAACDDRETPIPFFRARHLTECAWANVAECDELPPDILEDLICEEQGALLARWQRETNVGLAAAFEAGEIRIAELEGRARALTRRNERQVADLRQRRRHPDATPAMRAAMAEVIRELEDENDAAVADLARARAAMRAEAEAEEERLWARDDLLLEVERVQVIRWRARGAVRDGLPERRRQYATAFMPASGRTGVEEQTADEVLVQFDTALARSAEQEARRKAAEAPLPVAAKRVVPVWALPKHSPVRRHLQEKHVETTPNPVVPKVHVPAVTHHVITAAPAPAPPDEPVADPPVAWSSASHWTPDRVALLTRMWEEGHTAATIGQVLDGVSRNAVIGKAKRLGLPFRHIPVVEDEAEHSTPAAAECQEPEPRATPVQRALAALAQARQRFWGKEG